MVHTLTVLTLKLAQAIGLYWLAAGIGLLIAPDRLRAMLDDLEAHPGLVYAVGIGVFAIGVGILIPHHILSDPLSMVVTAIAVLIAAEGLLLIAFPQALLALARPLVGWKRIWAIVAILLGLVLLIAGLTGRADALP